MKARKKGRKKESNLNNKNRNANRAMKMNVATAVAAAASIGIEIHTKSISRIHKTNMIQCTLHTYILRLVGRDDFHCQHQKMTVNVLVIVLIIERKRSDNLQTIATLNLAHVHMLCSTHMMLTVV